MSKKLESLIEKYSSVSEKSVKVTYDIDPSDNKKYVEWLFKVRFYKKDGQNKFYVKEDFPANIKDKVTDGLTWFENNKNGRIPKDKRDINVFKSIESFLFFIEEMRLVKSRSEMKNEVDIVFDNEIVKIISPKTFEVSKLYGRNTTWCTTQKEHFDEYTSCGVLYYMMIKPLNRKLGFHLEFSGCANEDVDSIYWEFYNNEDYGLELEEITNVLGLSFKEYLRPVVNHFNNLSKNRIKDLEKEAFKKDLNNVLNSGRNLTDFEIKDILEECLKEPRDLVVEYANTNKSREYVYENFDFDDFVNLFNK